ncbi:MAG: hypothetical protein GC155_11605 [Alphaproteobacteria bacterium]|nr:hypothetical protein [Alphaproteobacteria bacterium]
MIWIALVAAVIVIGGSWFVAKSMRTRLIVFVAASLAAGAYLWLGHPSKPDEPLSGRVSELEARATKAPDTLTASQIMAIAEQRSKLKPKDPMPHYIMGIVLQNTGKAREAILAFESALRRDPKNEPAMVALADLLFESSGKVDGDVLKLYEQARQMQPGDLRLGYMVGIGEWQAGKRDEAEALWASLEQKAPPGDTTLRDLADGLFSMSGEMTPYNQTLYSLAYKHDPSDARLGYMLGVGEWQAGHEADAMARWKALAEKAPKGDQTLKTVADDLFKVSGRVDPWTTELYRMAWAKNPDDLRVGYLLGVGEWQAGKKAEADALWASIEARTPEGDPRQKMFEALKETFRKDVPVTINVPSTAPGGPEMPPG